MYTYKIFIRIGIMAIKANWTNDIQKITDYKIRVLTVLWYKINSLLKYLVH